MSDDESAEVLPDDSPYVWLIQEEAGGSSGSTARWAPVRARDNRRLEQVWQDKPNSVVPVEFGRYDVDLQRRTIRAVYWDEAERRVLRSSWFHGRDSDRTPYEEEDAAEIEAAFQRLRSGRERVPLLVPVNKGSQDVRFEAVSAPETEENSKHPLSFFIGSKEKGHVTAGSRLAQTEGGAPLWTALQESVDRTREQPPLPVWRGHPLLEPSNADAALEEDDEEHLPETVDCLVFVVHGIGQYHRSQQGATEAFYREVGKVRNLACKRLRRRLRESLPVHGRIEFLPLEWFEPIHVEFGIGKRLQHVTLPSVPALRDFANFAIADMVVYLDDAWRDTIHRELRRKMNRLWCLYSQRTPEYAGKVSIIGHSLGAVIMFDLMQKSLPLFGSGLLAGSSDADPRSRHAAADARAHQSSEPEEEQEQEQEQSDLPGSTCPAPRCFFAIGSPLGMFLSIRFAQKGESAVQYFRGLDVRWPAGSVGCGWRFFNIFHPVDPIAYRIEPLLNPLYRDTPPKVVLHNGGLRFHHQMREWWRTLGSSSSSKLPSDKACAESSSFSDTTLADVLLVPSPQEGGPKAAEFLDEPNCSRQGAAVDRLDWAIQEGVLESVNELLSAIHSHFAYWECEDLVQFITDQLVDALECKAREHAPPGYGDERLGVTTWPRRNTA